MLNRGVAIAWANWRLWSVFVVDTSPKNRGPHSGQRLHGKIEMKKTVLLLLAVSFYSATGLAGKPAKSKVTVEQARALVMASLTPQQRQLPKVEAVHFDDPHPARFLIFTVVWKGLPKGSVVAGAYAVDLYTGDVFEANQECTEVKNKRLEAIQAQVRAKLHLSQSEYQRLKTKGPLCEE